MIYLELVNAVLRRLREDEVVSVTANSYAKLVGDFINEAKREVEDAWDWVALRDTIQATTSAGNYRYIMSNTGNRVKIRDVFNDTTNNYLKLYNSTRLTEKFNSEGQSGEPLYYDFSGLYVDDYQIDVYPIPDGVYVLNINIVRPQADLSAGTDELTVHEYPVILGAYAKALAERGDDNGMQYPVAYKAYQDALSDAIQIDAGKNNVFTYDWYPM